jgi:hypothetical protein
MTPERLEELKAILDEDGYFVTDDIRELIAEVERLRERDSDCSCWRCREAENLVNM